MALLDEKRKEQYLNGNKMYPLPTGIVNSAGLPQPGLRTGVNNALTGIKQGVRNFFTQHPSQTGDEYFNDQPVVAPGQVWRDIASALTKPSAYHTEQAPKKNNPSGTFQGGALDFLGRALSAANPLFSTDTTEKTEQKPTDNISKPQAITQPVNKNNPNNIQYDPTGQSGGSLTLIPKGQGYAFSDGNGGVVSGQIGNDAELVNQAFENRVRQNNAGQLFGQRQNFALSSNPNSRYRDFENFSNRSNMKENNRQLAEAESLYSGFKEGGIPASKAYDMALNVARMPKTARREFEMLTASGIEPSLAMLQAREAGEIQKLMSTGNINDFLQGKSLLAQRANRTKGLLSKEALTMQKDSHALSQKKTEVDIKKIEQDMANALSKSENKEATFNLKAAEVIGNAMEKGVEGQALVDLMNTLRAMYQGKTATYDQGQPKESTWYGRTINEAREPGIKYN